MTTLPRRLVVVSSMWLVTSHPQEPKLRLDLWNHGLRDSSSPSVLPSLKNVRLLMGLRAEIEREILIRMTAS